MNSKEIYGINATPQKKKIIQIRTAHFDGHSTTVDLVPRVRSSSSDMSWISWTICGYLKCFWVFASMFPDQAWMSLFFECLVHNQSSCDAEGSWKVSDLSLWQICCLKMRKARIRLWASKSGLTTSVLTMKARSRHLTIPNVWFVLLRNQVWKRTLVVSLIHQRLPKFQALPNRCLLLNGSSRDHILADHCSQDR